MRWNANHTLSALFLASVLVIPSAVSIACSNERQEGTGTSKPTFTPDPTALAAANVAALTLGDLPPGWTEQPEKERSESPISDYCDLEGASGFRALAEVATRDFVFADKSFSETVTVFSNEEDANGAMSTYTELVNGCDWKGMARDEGTFGSGAGQITNVDIAPLSLKKYGDRTEALRITLTATISPTAAPNLNVTLQIPADIVLIRSGRMIALLISVQMLTTPGSFTEEIALLASDKLKSALPVLGGQPPPPTPSRTPTGLRITPDNV